MMKGCFITFEGGEGSGKSTQAALLADALEKTGLSIVRTREPGGTTGSEAIRTLLLTPPGTEWGVRAEALLFAAARADHVEKRIRPALDQGQWVISDRFIDSSRAYQGGAGHLTDQHILTLHAIGSDNLMPHLTVFLHVSPEEAEGRLQKRDGDSSDAIGGRDLSYHSAVSKTFHNLSKKEPERFATVNADGSIMDIHTAIMSIVKERLLSRDTIIDA